MEGNAAVLRELRIRRETEKWEKVVEKMEIEEVMQCLKNRWCSTAGSEYWLRDRLVRAVIREDAGLNEYVPWYESDVSAADDMKQIVGARASTWSQGNEDVAAPQMMADVFSPQTWRNAAVSECVHSSSIQVPMSVAAATMTVNALVNGTTTTTTKQPFAGRLNRQPCVMVSSTQAPKMAFCTDQLMHSPQRLNRYDRDQAIPTNESSTQFGAHVAVCKQGFGEILLEFDEEDESITEEEINQALDRFSVFADHSPTTFRLRDEGSVGKAELKESNEDSLETIVQMMSRLKIIENNESSTEYSESDESDTESNKGNENSVEGTERTEDSVESSNSSKSSAEGIESITYSVELCRSVEKSKDENVEKVVVEKSRESKAEQIELCRSEEKSSDECEKNEKIEEEEKLRPNAMNFRSSSNDATAPSRSSESSDEFSKFSQAQIVEIHDATMQRREALKLRLTNHALNENLTSNVDGSSTSTNSRFSSLCVNVEKIEMRRLQRSEKCREEKRKEEQADSDNEDIGDAMDVLFFENRNLENPERPSNEIGVKLDESESKGRGAEAEGEVIEKRKDETYSGNHFVKCTGRFEKLSWRNAEENDKQEKSMNVKEKPPDSEDEKTCTTTESRTIKIELSKSGEKRGGKIIQSQENSQGEVELYGTEGKESSEKRVEDSSEKRVEDSSETLDYALNALFCENDNLENFERVPSEIREKTSCSKSEGRGLSFKEKKKVKMKNEYLCLNFVPDVENALSHMDEIPPGKELMKSSESKNEKRGSYPEEKKKVKMKEDLP